MSDVNKTLAPKRSPVPRVKILWLADGIGALGNSKALSTGSIATGGERAGYEIYRGAGIWSGGYFVSKDGRSFFIGDPYVTATEVSLEDE